MAQKKIKHAVIRLPEDLHRKAKLEAYALGMTLQGWLTLLIENALLQRTAIKDFYKECQLPNHHE